MRLFLHVFVHVFVLVPLTLILVAGSAALAAPHGPHDLHGRADSLPFPQVEPTEEPSEETAEEDAEGEDGQDARDGWDVDAPPESLGPTFEIPLDVDEGTWMSLDVSPDGTEIAFDLLGDLYTLPLEGGEARSLTSGMAWDMQPRYSPDGETLVFTSDRGGGDNLWLIDRDGSDPRPVSEEDFRLLNSPVWTPDGRFVAGRKHFTSRRSLGAGEIWLYHRSGGSGLQMVEKPNEQKDLGEPAFSPDGRYLYYSQDTTPGGIFEYNKDPNTAIYTIQRLDRWTGETVAFVSGPGGAIRPTPSPDGRYLAFVRRVRTDSVLFLKDLDSLEEWPVYRHLDRDMQETWAVHGVYPSMAWTPDSQSLVFWAEGEIRRLDVSSGEVAEIPFRVQDTRRVVEPLRVPVEVHPERFEAKMLRWVEVAPGGERAVFEALGRIWVVELPDGTPRRLTAQEEHQELYPAFSRDGRSVVYVTWDDAELGSVRVAPVSGGEGRVVTPRPGHYVEPAMSPDGRWIVYRRIDGGYLRTPTWSQETGIYKVPASGDGEPVKLTSEGIDPHFGAASDHVYLMRFVDEGRRALVSLGLDGPGPDGTKERRHLVSDNATEYRVSPDGDWVAFREYFAAYVAPFVATGKSQSLGPKATSLPVRQVSKDAGEYLHWSGDSTRLHWALGADLSTIELAEALDFLRDPQPETEGEGGDGESAEDGDEAELPIETVRLSLEVTSDRPEGVVALVGGRVITLADGSVDPAQAVIEDGTVVVDGNRIRAVGPRDQVAVPAGAHVIDLEGKTVIPGLVDVHWHGAQGTDEIVPEQSWVDFATLAFGVTTIHDPSNDTSTIFAAAEQARAGRITAPRIFSTGTILYGAKAPFKAVIEGYEDARFHVRKLAAVGAISVKSYNQPRRDQRQQVLAAARELGMMVFPEGGSLFQHNLTMVVDGHTGIEHSIPVAAIYDDVRQLWGGTPRVGYTPTLVVGYGGLWGENYWYAKTRVWENERLLTFVPRELIDARSRRRTLAPDEEWGHFHNARVTAELDDEGVLVQLGAHGQREGLGAHWELWMFEQGGMTELEALRAATWNGAVYLGMEQDIGSIEEGKLADLVVLTENPLEDIRNSETVETVVLNGRVYDAATMDQIYPERVEREPFYWQRDPGAFSEMRTSP